MKKIINFEFLEKILLQKGLNKSDLADKLDISRQAVSKWFSEETQPSNSKLAEIAKILSIKFEEFIKLEYLSLPKVEFRLNRNAKTTDDKINSATDMGYYLKKLVKYVPFDYLTKPPVLLKPELNYSYIENVTNNFRNEYELKNKIITYNDIIKLFNIYHTILIPILWGKNDKKINGLRIYLQENMINWVYLNLDTNKYDFKFWMLHELGHIVAQEIEKNDSEKFANNFAGSLLFGENMVKSLHDEILHTGNAKDKIDLILIKAKELTISPFTIYYRLKAFTEHYNKKEIEIEIDFYKRATGLINRNKKISDAIFDRKKPEAKEYIKFINDNFHTPIFKMLKNYLNDTGDNVSYIKKIFDISYIDAKNLYDAIR